MNSTIPETVKMIVTVGADWGIGCGGKIVGNAPCDIGFLKYKAHEGSCVVNEELFELLPENTFHRDACCILVKNTDELPYPCPPDHLGDRYRSDGIPVTDNPIRALHLARIVACGVRDTLYDCCAYLHDHPVCEETFECGRRLLSECDILELYGEGHYRRVTPAFNHTSYVIATGEMYFNYLSLVDTIYVNKLRKSYPAEVYFPNLDAEDSYFELRDKEDIFIHCVDGYSFQTLKYTRKEF